MESPIRWWLDRRAERKRKEQESRERLERFSPGILEAQAAKRRRGRWKLLRTGVLIYTGLGICFYILALEGNGYIAAGVFFFIFCIAHIDTFLAP